MGSCHQTGLSITRNAGSSAQSRDGNQFASVSLPVKWHEYILQEYVNFLTFPKGLWDLPVQQELPAADSPAAFSR